MVGGPGGDHEWEGRSEGSQDTLDPGHSILSSVPEVRQTGLELASESVGLPTLPQAYCEGMT